MDAWRRWNGHFAGRVVAAALLTLLVLLPYDWLNRTLTPRFDLSTPLDRALPFWPWTLPLYQSFYLLILAGAWVCRAEEFGRVLGAVLVANLVAYAGFVALPAHYPRPELAQIAEPWRGQFAALFAADPPGNTFPSLHVAVTWLLTLRLRQRPGGRWWLGWGALVALSTLTVKQHFVVDVVGGWLLATALDRWWLRTSASV